VIELFVRTITYLTIYYTFNVHFMIKKSKVDLEAKSSSTFRLEERVPTLLVYYINPIFIAGRK